jgi:hypothetical protein
MEPISNVPGDDATSTIFCDGLDAGVITRCMVDVGMTSRQVRVGSYSVEFWDESLCRFDASFVPKGQSDRGAVAALMAARNHARKVLATTERAGS